MKGSEWMYRGTTPALTLRFNVDVSEAQDIWVMFWVGGGCGESELTLKKSDRRVTANEDGKSVTVSLTEEESLRLGQSLPNQPGSSYTLYVQAKVKMAEGDIRATAPVVAPSEIRQIIDDGVMG